MTGVPIRRPCGDDDAQKDGHRKMEPEIGVMLPEVKKHQEPPEAGRSRKDSPLEPLKGA